MEQMTSICDMVGQYMQKKEEEKRIAEEQAAKDRYWKIPNSLRMNDEDYVENLVPIPSESEGIPDSVCDVPLCNNPTPLEAFKEHSETIIDSNNDYSSRIVIPEVGGIDDDILLTIKDDILREKLLNVNLLIANIEALKDNPVPSSDFWAGTTTHADFSQYDSFIFDLSINPFPPADRSDFYHEEFADELAHIISPPEYDHFCFKIEPELGNLTMDVARLFPFPCFVFYGLLSRMSDFEASVLRGFALYPQELSNPHFIWESDILNLIRLTLIFSIIFINGLKDLRRTKNDRVKYELDAKQGLFGNLKSSFFVGCQKPGHLAARLGCAETKVATWDDLAFKLIILRYRIFTKGQKMKPNRTKPRADLKRA
ncbi:hypothetical protein Tco_0502681 [Tanacetum coccineum]